MRCPRCQQDNPLPFDVCAGCGAPLAPTCAECGADLPAGSRFCNKCGVPVAVGSGGPPRFASPESYTPQHLVQKILTSRSALEGERKQVTVLFCDLVNSTGLAERIGAEAMHDLLNQFFALALAEVHRYEGTINQFLGDGFMALFGAPIAHEDHPRRAVLAAFGIRRLVGQQREALVRPRGLEVAVRMGLHTGFVVVGKIGNNLRMDYTAVGDTTNLAARLQQQTEPGEIHLSDATYRLVEPYVKCRLLGETRVKGRAEPVVVYRLVDTRARPEPRRRELRSVGSPLVGREVEVATFLACLDRLRAGRGGIVGVLGEPGQGKSRLVAEVSRTVTDRGLLWLEGRALSFGQTLSYWPFLEILRRWVSITEEDDDAAGWIKLEQGLQGLFADDILEILPYLATLLGFRVPQEFEHRVKYLDGQAMGRQIFRSVRRLCERLAQRRPLVLVFEDLHWTDQSSSELIEHLFHLVERVPVLLCGVGRPERQSPAAHLRRVARTSYAAVYTEIVLSPLGPMASSALIENLVGSPHVPEPLRERIVQKTEGNPFFMEEVIRSMIATGAVAWDATAGHWRVTREVEQIAIPDTLQGVITARIDRLDEDVKQVLKTASVIGRSFFYRILQAVVEAGLELDRHLHDLQDVELIREKQLAPELEYIFKHALVQEATYESILLDRRRRLHRKVGDCIERLFADRLDEFSGMLAYHYARAEAWEKAQGYLFRAGDQAGRMSADAEALTHYRLAVEAYARVLGERWDPVQRAILERKIGEALSRRGRHGEAVEYLHRALALLGAPFPAAGVLPVVRELLRQAVHRIVPALVRWRSTPPTAAEQERLHIYGIMPWIDYFVDKDRFLLDVLLLLNFAESRRHTVGAVEGCTGLGIICDHIRAFRLADLYHRRALMRAKESGDPLAIGHAYLGLCMHESYRGALGPALEQGRLAAAAYQETGELRGWGTVTTMMAVVLFLRGEIDATLDWAQQLIRVGQETAHQLLLGFGLYVQGRVLCQTGRLDEAIAGLQQAVAVFGAMPDYHGVADAQGVLGQCYLRQNRIADAVKVLEESTNVIAVHALRGHQITVPRNALTEAYLGVAEHAQGVDREVALKKAQEASHVSLRQGKTFRGGLPQAMRLEGTRSWMTGRYRAAQMWWTRGRKLAEELGIRYEMAMTVIEMARRMGDRQDLDRAERLLTDLGATADAAVCRALSAAGQPARQPLERSPN
jgi:class 3 adenylate cyclase/tetratricopeptide (TPR) repeat protein